MGRKTVYKIGDKFGKLEILEILPTKSGIPVKLRCLCHACNSETIISGHNQGMKKRKSCGCQQRNSKLWKRKGAINRPWQLPSGESARRNVLYSYKRGAEKRKVPFLLTEEEFNNLIIGNCFYCGDSLTSLKKGQGKTSGDFKYTGIDRIDSHKGYDNKNSISCCWMCNNMKSNYDQKLFLRQVEKIWKNNYRLNLTL